MKRSTFSAAVEILERAHQLAAVLAVEHAARVGHLSELVIDRHADPRAPEIQRDGAALHGKNA